MTIALNDKERMAKEIGKMVERHKVEFAIQELEFVEVEIASCQRCVCLVSSHINRLKKRLEGL